MLCCDRRGGLGSRAEVSVGPLSPDRKERPSRGAGVAGGGGPADWVPGGPSPPGPASEDLVTSAFPAMSARGAEGSALCGGGFRVGDVTAWRGRPVCAFGVALRAVCVLCAVV